MQPLIVPPPYNPQEPLALITPSWHASSSNLARCYSSLTKAGFKLITDYVANSHSPTIKAQKLNSAFKTSATCFLWALRGGEGAISILDKLEYKHLREYPKWIMGFSDVTALLIKAWIECKLVTIHGPTATSKHNLTPEKLSKLTLSPPAFLWQAHNHNRRGTCYGWLIGGNLSLIHSLTDSELSNLRNSILVIEEVGEHMHTIHRLLTSLYRRGLFKIISGLIVGTFTDIKLNSKCKNCYPPLEQVILDVVDNIPVAFLAPFGHVYHNKPFWHGFPYMLKVDKHTVLLKPI